VSLNPFSLKRFLELYMRISASNSQRSQPRKNLSQRRKIRNPTGVRKLDMIPLQSRIFLELTLSVQESHLLKWSMLSLRLDIFKSPKANENLI